MFLPEKYIPFSGMYISSEKGVYSFPKKILYSS